MSSFTATMTIRSSGSIATILPLHVDGRYIKDSLNNTFYLRGIWDGAFADTSTGWWGLNACTWDETALRHTLQTLQQQWRANCINFFIWGDWWLQNQNATLMGGKNQTNIGERDAIVQTVQIAAQYGIYVQIRLWGCNRTQGRIEGLPFTPYTNWTVQDFVNFWVNVSTILQSYPNAIYCLFDEPTGNETTWFKAANQTIVAMRGNGTNQLILNDYGYCGDMIWVADWVNGGYPLYNIFFDEHIYRRSGTFAYKPNSPVDINYIRRFLANSPSGTSYTGTGTEYIENTYNVPVWIGAIGAYNGATNDEEYVYLTNTLEVLNEWGIGYVVYNAFRTNSVWTVLQNPSGQVFGPPNRVGQALINAIAGIVPPPTYQLGVNSNLAATQFNMRGNIYSTPFGPLTEFAGNYIVSMPPSIMVYTHDALFGGTNIAGAGGYYSYIYTAGPYTINSSATVSSINLFTVVAGKAKVAVYGSMKYNLSGWPANYMHPGSLIVTSLEQQCQANTWNTFDIKATLLNAGTYFLAVKTDTNGMLTATSRGYFGQFIPANYASPFPNPFGTIAGATGTECAVYIPLAPIQTSTHNFVYWEDNSTNPTRTINLTTNMTLTATYHKTF